MADYNRPLRMDKKWSLKEAFINATERHDPRSRTGGPMRMKCLHSWGQIVGRTRALQEFKALLAECGSINKMAKMLRSTKQTMENLKLFFIELPDDRETVFTQQYEKKKPALHLFREKVERLVRELLGATNLKVSSIESRVKDTESFVEKACSPKKNYLEPFSDITDQVGIRIIAFYKEDVEEICGLLRGSFKVDEENSVDKTAKLKVDQVGYHSVHLVVEISKSRLEQLEWKSCEGLKAEVQVRTVLQHAWAQIEHQLNYKATSSLSRAMQRQLYNLSALLEIGDREFSRLQSDSVKEVEKYQAEIPERNYYFEINQESLSVFLCVNRQLHSLLALGVEQGLVEPGYRNEKEEEYYLEGICEACEFLEISELIELDALMEGTSRPLFVDFLQMLRACWGEQIGEAGIMFLALVFNVITKDLDPQKARVRLQEFGKVMSEDNYLFLVFKTKEAILWIRQGYPA